MTQATHTPGPWHIGDRFCGRFIYDARGWAVADFRGAPDSKIPSAQKDANGALIAAAPDMLAALQEAVRSLDYACTALEAPQASAMRANLTDCRAAIAAAKAKGL